MSQVEDIARTMRLLWRSEGEVEATSKAPGPSPRLEVDEIVAAAVAVADASPSAGLSMRAVAERVGVTAMALYGYVPSKEALVALAYDAIHAEVGDQEDSRGDWRERTIAWAEDLVGMYVRHAWALRVSFSRPVLGPNEQRVLESLVAVMRPTGLEPDGLRRVVGLIFHAVRGTARTVAEAREAAEGSAITEGEWWQGASRALGDVVLDFDERFPHTVWLLSESTERPAAGQSYVEWQSGENLRAGLEVLLDGVEASMSD